MNNSKNLYHLPPAADTHIADLTRLPEIERGVISEIFADAMATPTEEECHKQLLEFGRFAVEVADNDYAQRKADLHLKAAKTYADRQFLAKAELAATPTIIIDSGKIRWLEKDKPLTIELQLAGDSGEEYLFGSIVDQHPTTIKAYQKLHSKGFLPTLEQTLVDSAIPTLLKNISGGSRRLRPVNKTGGTSKEKSNDRNVDTRYASYKVDVQGTSNRAILLLPDKIDGKQVVLLAAMYYHEDQDQVFRAICK